MCVTHARARSDTQPTLDLLASEPSMHPVEALRVTALSSSMVWLTIFVLAVFVGIEVISKVSSTLHTPLMSGANAIHGVILIGAILVAGSADSTPVLVLGLVAVVLAVDQHGRRFRGHRPDAADVLAARKRAVRTKPARPELDR